MRRGADVLNAIFTGVRVAVGRLLLGLVFGAIAIVLAQQVAGNVAEQLRSAPTTPPGPTPAAAR